MIATVKKLLGKKKTILLSVPAYFPTWHSRFGEETGFRECILGGRHPKVHAIKGDIEFWRQMDEKYRTGRYRLVVCNMGDDPYREKYYPILSARRLHIQEARFMQNGCHILVDNKPVGMETIARNEGLSLADFLEWRKYLEEKEFCIVHFTAFRY